MNKALLNIIVLLVLCGNAVFAQPAGKLFQLESEEINKPKILVLFQNTAGLILCGTTKGLYRFDGFDFYRYHDPFETKVAVTAICETSDHQTWVGFDNGNIGILHGGEITLLNFPEGFPRQAIKSIIQSDDKVIWIGTAGEGIYYYKRKRLYNINTDDGLSDDYIYRLINVRGTGIVAATDRGINICSLLNDKKQIRTYTSKDGLPDNMVRSIYTAGNNILWLGMQDAGIIEIAASIKGKNTSFTPWHYGQVNDIIASDAGVFVATEDSSLISFAYNNDHTLHAEPSINHAVPKPTCLLRDREGNIWAAGSNLLLRTPRTEIENCFVLEQKDADQVHCLYADGDSLVWFNTSNGIASFKPNEGKRELSRYTVPAFAHTTITALYRDTFENLWIGSMGKGIVLFNASTHAIYNLPYNPLIAQGNVISITGKADKVWIASLEGVVQATVTRAGISYTNFTDTASIGSKYVYHIFTDSRNRVWFATDGEGLILFENGKFTQLKHRSGYVGDVVYKIAEDRLGNIWYATYDKGLVKYDGTHFTAFSADQGLSDPEIAGLQTAGANLAIIHRNSIDLLNPVTGKINYPDRPQKFDINTDLNASAANSGGDIFVVASGAIYNYHSKLSSLQQPTVIIDRVRLFLKDIDTGAVHNFRYDENNFSFFYSGLFYTQPEKVLYQYKLDNYSKEWVITRDKMLNFPRLPPGNYTFRIRASLHKDFRNSTEASFSFVIEKPFWLQPWFIIFFVAFFATCLYFFIKQRERQVKRWASVEKEKIQSQLQTLRSQINPHFLFNSFNTLISEIESEPDDAVVYVEHLSDFYRSIVMHRDKNLISLEEELIILRDYCFLQQKRYNSGFSVTVEIADEEMHKWCVAPFALQLLVENAVKHNIASKDTPLYITVSLVNNNYLMVRNNINRKLQTGKETGMGLQNIKQRYSLLCGMPVLVNSDQVYFTVQIPLLKNMA